MTARPGVIGPVLAGRDGELGTVGAFLERAASGAAGALIVSGDTGVGKTALVNAACASRPTAVVLRGAGLPLTSLSVPFLALRQALRGAPQIERDALARMLGSGESSAHVPVMVDTWLDDLSRDRLVVLFIDDLDWADQSTLDVLMYLIAGPAERRLAVITTVRSDAVRDGHPLQRWLDDVRRLPGVDQLTLDPLDRVATAAQIENILGAPPQQSLVQDVYTHTLGNAYLTQLAVTGLDPNASRMASPQPADLRAAVLSSWHRLSPPTREITRILAVGGRPRPAPELEEVIRGRVDADEVSTLLREAVDAGTLDLAPNGSYWFHHPLTAEVLEQGLSDEQRRRWHSVFAEHEERQLRGAADPAAVESMVAVADHHYRAGAGPEAYRWALSASTAAGAAGGTSEMLRLLRRALELRNGLPGVPESEPELLERLRAAAALAGANTEELYAIEGLLARTDAEVQPLLAAELLVRRMHLRFSTGRAFLDSADAREAVRLSKTEPASWQHALALAELAHAETWQGDPAAAAHAHRALAVARAAGDPRALTYALAAEAVVAVAARRGDDALAFATEALDAAVAAGDFWAFCHATLWEANALETWSTRRYAEQLRRRREEMTALGAPHSYIAWLSAVEACDWLAIGEWRECLDRLRVALGSDPGPMADVHARLAAARLAALQGRPDEAEAHLARSQELLPAASEFLALEFDAIRAEVHLASGNPVAAYDAAMTGATSAGVAPTMCEWLMPLAARALADQLQRERDGARDPCTLLARVDELVDRFPSVIRDFGDSTAQSDLQVQALDDLYVAEVGRARHDPDNGSQWVRAADSAGLAELAWEEAYACWRGAEALLVHGRHHREPAARMLRRGLDLAEQLHALPVLRGLSELAEIARIPVGRVAASPGPEPRGCLPGLTSREREILDLVIVGRTYGEIARALVISEKTVSSHISNLLRKTGTENRVDLSRLATHARDAV